MCIWDEPLFRDFFIVAVHTAANKLPWQPRDPVMCMLLDELAAGLKAEGADARLYVGLARQR